MEAIIVLFFVVVAWAFHHENVKRKKQIKAAYDFNPANKLGGARFANNDDLREAGLFKGKGVPIGYSPDGRHALHYRGQGHLLTVAAARTGKGTTLLIPALLSWHGSCQNDLHCCARSRTSGQ